ncbi:MAG TPA: hydroxyacylglutathione hydrolase [Chromatiales bacterium]|nr:hydroxyacylglutathione hydrolase [Thiotrichales bacterium]HIP67412.1 hydroxyacylglutathione hydrolase [Chromatiales bacterium]
MLKVIPIRAFADNYIWLLQGENKTIASVVDPGDATPVLHYLDQHQIELKSIIITHHHGDHVGGIQQLLQHFPDIPVYGPAREKIPAITHQLKDQDEITDEGSGQTFLVMDVPGHTAGHIAYYGDGRLFCGDTVFANGCGRVFDGTFEQLCHSLKKISKLPDETLIYCAHEYTVDNIGFAKWVEPENQVLLERDKIDFSRSEKGQPTVPSKLALEKQTNPFLRFTLPEVKLIAEQKAGRALQNDCEVFTVLRQWKDREYD